MSHKSQSIIPENETNQTEGTYLVFQNPNHHDQSGFIVIPHLRLSKLAGKLKERTLRHSPPPPLIKSDRNN